MADNCLFCNITAGHIGSVKVYENDDVLAFMDIVPSRPGHVLIVPKQHSNDLLDASAAAITAVAKASIVLANAVKAATGADGIRVMQFNGAAAGQTVFHYHLHIIPVMAGDGFVSHGREPTAVEDLQSMAEKIRAQLSV